MPGCLVIESGQSNVCLFCVTAQGNNIQGIYKRTDNHSEALLKGGNLGLRGVANRWCIVYSHAPTTGLKAHIAFQWHSFECAVSRLEEHDCGPVVAEILRTRQHK
jgi:hypothetical protein